MKKEAKELGAKLDKAEVDWQMKFNHMENDLTKTIDEKEEKIMDLENNISDLNRSITMYL